MLPESFKFKADYVPTSSRSQTLRRSQPARLHFGAGGFFSKAGRRWLNLDGCCANPRQRSKGQLVVVVAVAAELANDDLHAPGHRPRWLGRDNELSSWPRAKSRPRRPRPRRALRGRVAQYAADCEPLVGARLGYNDRPLIRSHSGPSAARSGSSISELKHLKSPTSAGRPSFGGGSFGTLSDHLSADPARRTPKICPSRDQGPVEAAPDGGPNRPNDSGPMKILDNSIRFDWMACKRAARVGGPK